MSTTLNCVNCGFEQVEAYCARCGQRARRSRFALRPLLRQAADDAFNLDRGLLHTVLALSRRPGRAVAEYLQGRTRPYANPAKYLVIWVAVSTLAYHNSSLFATQVDLLGEAGAPELDAAMTRMADLLTRYSNVLMILTVPLLAALSRFFFRGAGYTYTEHLIFNVYVYAHQNVIFAAMLPVNLLVLSDPNAFLALYTLVAVAFYAWACRGFFRVSVLAAAVRGVLINALGQIGFWALFGAVLAWVLVRGALG